MAAMHSRGDALMYATEASQAWGFFWFPVSCGEKNISNLVQWDDFLQQMKQQALKKEWQLKKSDKEKCGRCRIQNYKKAAFF